MSDLVEFSSSKAVLPNMVISVKDDLDNVIDVDYDDKLEEKKDTPNVEIKLKNFTQNLNENMEYQEEKFAKDDIQNNQVKNYIENLNKYNLSCDTNTDNCIRLDTLHLKGVNNLSTNQVFQLFDGFAPQKIEWINDFSCNVVWNDEKKAIWSFLKVTKPKEKSKDKVINDNKDADDLDLMEIEPEEQTVEEDEVNPLLLCDESFNPKDKTLQLRFATFNDKKVAGASKKSEYYQKFGNPHFGGIKGVISSSYKRRFYKKKVNEELKNMKVETNSMRMQKRRIEDRSSFRYKRIKTEEEKKDQALIETSINDLEDSDFDLNDGGSSDDGFPLNSMHADYEEENIKRKQSNAKSQVTDLREILKRKYKKEAI